MKAITKVLALTALAMMVAVGFCSLLHSDDSSADSVETDYDRYYYNQLSPLGQDLYDRWICLSTNGDDEIVFEYDLDLSLLSTTSVSELSTITAEINSASNAAIYAFSNERYDVFWLKNALAWEWNYWYSGDEITKIHIAYTAYFVNDYPDVNVARMEVYNALATVDLDTSSWYSTVRSIHDATVKLLSYAAYTDDEDYSIRSVFRDVPGDHAVVCEGYAKMFKALCDMHGIPCLLISGHGQGEAHMWNYVMMDDGKWYGVDCTWDDQNTLVPVYFLVGTSTEVFNGATFGEDHVADRMGDLELPVLSTTAYNDYHTVYFISSGTKVNPIDVADGGTAVLHVNPTRTGFTFYQWSLDSEPFDLSTPITGNIVLVADWTYTDIGGDTGDVTWSFDPTTETLTISGTGAMGNYDRDGNQRPPWYAYEKSIRYLVIESGVTYVGENNFCEMNHLISVTLPATVTSINTYGFMNSMNIVEVNVEDGGLEVEKGSMSNGCVAMHARVINTGTESTIAHASVPGGVLYYVTDGGEVYVVAADITDDTLTFPKSLGGDSTYHIGSYAFYYNEKLKNVVMLSDAYNPGVIEIGNYAFGWCFSLKSVGFTPGLTTIGEGAFYYCRILETVYLPAGLTSVGEDAFCLCQSLQVAELACSHLEEIPTGMFSGCTSLKELIIPDSVETIWYNAFYDCTALTRITFGSGLANLATDTISGLTFVIGGESYEEIPGDDGEERAAVVRGKTYSGPAGTLTEAKYNVVYLVDGEIINSVQYDAGATVTLAALPTVENRYVVGWRIPGTVVTDNTFTMPSNTVYATARTLIQYYTVTIDLGEGTVPGYAGIWDEVDSHTYTLDVASGTDVAALVIDDSSPMYFDDAAIVYDYHHFVSWSSPSSTVTEAMTIEATYAVDLLSLTFDKNGGDTDGNGTVVYGADTITRTVVPTKTGYFVDYYMTAASDGEMVAYSNGDLVEGVEGYTDAQGRWIRISDTTLYAHWSCMIIDIVLGGGTESGTAQVNYDGTEVTDIVPPVRANYHVSGYWSAPDGGVLVADADGALHADTPYTSALGTWTAVTETTLYARWDPDTFAVTIDKSGGTADGSAVATYYATAIGSISLPVKTGYFVGGIFIDPSCETHVADIEGALDANVDGYTDGNRRWIRESAATLYVAWIPTTYTVTLDKNGGDTNGVGYLDFTHTYIRIDDAPAKTAHHVTGYWSSASEGVQVADGEGTLLTNVEGYTDAQGHWARADNTTLYARWAPDAYDIILAHNLGDANGSAKAVYGATALSEIVPPTKAHYVLVGYYLDWEGETLVADTEGTFVEALDGYIEDHAWIRMSGATLYAKWTAATFLVTLDKNGGDTEGYTTATYGSSSFGQPWVYPQYAGHTMSGFYLEPSCERQVATNNNFISNVPGYTDGDGNWIRESPTTIYTKWVASLYSLHFYKTEGTADGSGNITFGTSTASVSTAPTWFCHHPVAFYADEERNVPVIVLSEGNYVTVASVDGYTDSQGKWVRLTNPTNLYTGWSGNQINLVLDKNGGSADGSAVVTYGSSAVSELSHAVRAGYTLDGYYSSNGEYLVMTSAGVLTQSADGYTDGSGNWIGYSTGQQGEIIHLVAHWTAKTTAVTLDKNTGSADSSVTATYDLALPEFSAISKDGFNLAGYFTASSGGVKVINADGTLVANVDGYTADGKWAYASPTLTLYAQWAPLTTAIHLNANGGSPDVELTFTYGKNLSYGGSFSYPTMNGYGAIGMFTERTDGLCIAQDSANFTYNVDGYVTNGLWTYVGAELTLYVQWAPHTTTLNLFHNDGSGEYTQTTIRFNDTSAAAFVNPTRTGYTLVGYTQEGRTDNVLNSDGTLVQNYDSMVVNGKWRQDTSTVPLYAYWVKNTTEITIYAYNGSGDTTSSTATYGEGITAFEPFTWRGYTLDGYFTEPYSGVMVIDASGALRPDVDGYTEDGVWILDRRALMLYAQWTPLTTEITLHRNTGTADGFVIATYDQPLPAFDGAVKTGYNATGYWISPSGINMLIDANGQLVDYAGTVEDGMWVYLLPTLTLYAQWAPKTTDITIEANDGSGNTRSATATYDSGITAFAAPTRAGYTVEGYYTEAGRGVKVLDANGALVNSDGYVANGKWANESAALTLYAHWSARNITLFIDANGGDSDIQTAIHYDSTSATIIPPSRTGYNVTGYWSAAQNGVKVINDDGTLVNSAGYVIDDQWADVVVGGKWAYLSESITLYAQWAPKTTAITILANGGDDDSSVTATYGSALPGFPVILRTGYSNNGYFTAAEGGTRVIDSNGVLLFNVQGYSVDGRWANESAELTLYAHWTIWTIPITIDANGGDADRNVIATYDTLPEFDAVTRTGYVLTGYFNESEGGAMVINADGTLVQNAAGYTADGKWTCVYDNLTLYAQWSPRSTAVILDKNGGAADRTTIATYDSGDLNAFEAVSRAGYVLTGYFTSADGGVMVVSSEGALAQNAAGYTAGGVWKYEGSDLTLYAQWQAHVTAIVLDKNGGQSDGQATVSYDGTSLTIAAYPVNTGYGVGGFLVASDGQKVAEGNGRLLPDTDYTDANGKWTSLADSVTLYTSWSDIVVDVTLEGVEGTDGTARAVVGGTMIEIAAPVRTGYDLEGYYADSARTLKVAQADGSLLSGVDGYTDDGALWIKEESCTLYAQWTAKTYRITLDKDGGTADGYVIATYGSSALTEFTPPVRTGYDPVGFFTEPEHLVEIVKTNGTLVGGHTVYTDDGVWTNDLTQPLTLYPYWVAKHTSITLDRNGGESDRGITAAYDAVLESFSPVSRTGYDLTGYWTAATGGSMVIGADGTLIANVAGYSADGKWANESEAVTFYAQWTAGTTSITIVSNGGGAARSATATYGGGITAFDPIAREGYTLNGYFSEGEGGVMVITAAGALSDSQGYVVDGKWANASAEVTLYAQWTAKTYTITLDKNGGTADGTATVTYGSSAITVTNAVWEWHTVATYTNNSGGGQWVINAQGALVTNAPGYTDADGKWIRDGDATVYAQWTAVMFTVTADPQGGTLTHPAGWTLSDGVYTKEFYGGTQMSGVIDVLGTAQKSPVGSTTYQFKDWAGYEATAVLSANVTVTAEFESVIAVPDPVGGTTTVDTVTETSATMTSADIDKVKADAKAGTLEKLDINMKNGSISLDSGSIQSLTSADLDVSIKKDEGVPNIVVQTAGGRSVYDIRIGDVHQFNGTLTITVDYQLKAGEDPNDLVVWNIKEDGTHEALKCTYANGKVTFGTTHLSYYAVMVDDSSPSSGGSDMTLIIAVVAVLAVAAIGAVFVLKRKKA